MGKTHRNLYLFLALACLLGIVLVFVFDGYMGVRDSVWVTGVDGERSVGDDLGRGGEHQYYSLEVEVPADGEINIRYELENRCFRGYTEDVRAIIRHENMTVAELTSGVVSLSPLAAEGFLWTVDVDEYAPAEWGVNRYYSLMLIIYRGGTDINVSLSLIPHTGMNTSVLIDDWR